MDKDITYEWSELSRETRAAYYRAWRKALGMDDASLPEPQWLNIQSYPSTWR